MVKKESSTYDRILNAATELFAYKGFKATTTREIAKSAGSSLSTLQIYFQSKENIYIEAVNRALSRQNELLQPLFLEIDAFNDTNQLNSGTAWNLIVDLVGKLVDWVFMDEERNYVKLMRNDMMNRSPIFSSIPTQGITTHSYLKKLFCAYANNIDDFSASFLSLVVVTALFEVTNYPVDMTNQIFECEMKDVSNSLKLKVHMKSYILTSIRKYLDELNA